MRQIQTPNDVFTYRSQDPHAAIPTWLIYCNDIKPEHFRLACAILASSQEPTRVELALALNTTERSIDRWLDEMRAAGVLTSTRTFRRNIYTIHQPGDTRSSDQVITDNLIEGSLIEGSLIRGSLIIGSGYSSYPQSDMPASEADKTRIPDHPISDPPGGGGDHDSEIDSPPTNHQTAQKTLQYEITTESGRWLVQEGFNVVSAAAFQHIPLHILKADIERRRKLGSGNGAIVQAWRVAPPLESPVEQLSYIDNVRSGKYGDGLRLGSDVSDLDITALEQFLDRRDPDVNQFLKESGL